MSRTRGPAWLLLCTCFMLLTLSAMAQVAQTNINDSETQLPNHILIVRGSLHNDVSPAVRDLPKLDQTAAAHVQHEAEPARRIPLPPGLKPASEPDPVWQRATASGGVNGLNTAVTPFVSTTPGLSFDGIGVGFPGFTVGVRLQTLTALWAPPNTSSGSTAPSLYSTRSPAQSSQDQPPAIRCGQVSAEAARPIMTAIRLCCMTSWPIAGSSLSSR